MGTLWPLGSVHCPGENWFPHSLTLLLCYPCPHSCSQPMPPTHSSLDMQGDIIHSLNEHAIYGTHTSCQSMKHCHIVSNRGSQRGGPAGIPPRKPVSLPGAGIMGKYASVISGLKWLQQNVAAWFPQKPADVSDRSSLSFTRVLDRDCWFIWTKDRVI